MPHGPNLVLTGQERSETSHCHLEMPGQRMAGVDESTVKPPPIVKGHQEMRNSRSFSDIDGRDKGIKCDAATPAAQGSA